MERLVQAASEDPQALLLSSSSVVGLAGVLAILTGLFRCLSRQVEPSLDECKGLLQEVTQSWTELKVALSMLSAQAVEFRKEFGEVRQAMLNSFEDKSKFDGTESEKFRPVDSEPGDPLCPAEDGAGEPRWQIQH